MQKKKESSDVQPWLCILKVLIILQISSFHFPSSKKISKSDTACRKFISALKCVRLVE